MLAEKKTKLAEKDDKFGSESEKSRNMQNHHNKIFPTLISISGEVSNGLVYYQQGYSTHFFSFFQSGLLYCIKVDLRGGKIVNIETNKKVFNSDSYKPKTGMFAGLEIRIG